MGYSPTPRYALKCGPTTTVQNKGEALTIPLSCTGNEVMKQLISVNKFTLVEDTPNTIASEPVNVLKNGNKSTAYAALGNVDCILAGDGNNNRIYFKTALTASDIVWICYLGRGQRKSAYDDYVPT